ncbi:hypothetical protein SAMN04488511_101515 [Pedobacter suwonensis]|uniref:Uncharacterized protein n=1 Tax=Pedobacter suwonensis TaxID=332999 RepID=A0A1I0SJR1_9SPHI|nr:hypothetical protein [Pedobacter suwonensis]SFA39749.1 hypothetical protein SAMN04488511_101515 [Pedobacter suwonensis]
MKKIFVITLGMILFSLNLRAQDNFDQWPASGHFHAIISQTFHPAAAGNCDPVKKRADELPESAILLHKCVIPAEFSGPGIIPAIHQRGLESATPDKLIKRKVEGKLILAGLNRCMTVSIPL